MSGGPPAGQDCTALPGVSDVSCTRSRCSVQKCMLGYDVHKNRTQCVESRRGWFTSQLLPVESEWLLYSIITRIPAPVKFFRKLSTKTSVKRGVIKVAAVAKLGGANAINPGLRFHHVCSANQSPDLYQRKDLAVVLANFQASFRPSSEHQPRYTRNNFTVFSTSKQDGSLAVR